MYKFPFPRSQVKFYVPLCFAILEQTNIPLLENNQKCILIIHLFFKFRGKSIQRNVKEKYEPLNTVLSSCNIKLLLLLTGTKTFE